MAVFEWDEAKRLRVLTERKIDFDDLDMLFADERSVVYPSPRNEEARFVIVGLLHFRFVSVVFTRRGEAIRIISARMARREEQALWLRNASKPS